METTNTTESTHPNCGFNNTTTAYIDLRVEHYHYISSWIRIYITPFIIFGGTIGNLLTIAVVLSRHFRYSPSSIPLITLAFVDIGVLYFNLLDVWLGAVFGGSLQYTRDISSGGCKFSTFITIFLTHFSSWILVLINVERVLSVYRPLKARTWCSHRRLALALFIILLFLALISIHLFWTTIYHADWETDRCQYNEHLFGSHGELIWLAIDASLFTFIPFIIILGSNIIIIYYLAKSKRQRSQFYQVPTNQSSTDSTKSLTMMLLTIIILQAYNTK